jgi:5,10-methylenetetrahydromethanopterin reductase
MRISLFSFLGGGRDRSPVDAYVEHLRAARDDGFTTVWTSQLPWEPDLLTTLAVALREVDGVTVGTAVQPIQLRHPMAMAQQALTLSLLSGGRLKLGLGLAHEVVSDGMWGVPWDRPLRRMGEYLDGLLPLLAGEPADATGEITSTRGRLRISGAPTPPVYVAALGPQMLRLAGRRTAGTVTWMAGPRTLADHVVPTLRGAAQEAGRTVEVVAGLPVCVTDDEAAAREAAARTFAMYGKLPSYRAMLDREGVAGPGDLALVGDEAAVAARFDEIRAAGVDELSAVPFGRGEEDRERTRAFLRSRR